MSVMSRPERVAYGTGRAAMLDATIAVVAEVGLRGLTYRAVAQRARVTNSLVAHHFKSRDGLVLAALEHATTRTLEAFAAAEGRGVAFADDVVTRLIGSDEALQLFQYELLLESRRRPELRDALRRQYDAYIDAWHQTLRRHYDTDDRALARAIAAAVDGLLLQQLTVATQRDVTAAVVRLRELLQAAGRLS